MSAVESKENVKLLQADAIRREYPIADVQKRWQSCQTFIDVLCKGILMQPIVELSRSEERRVGKECRL